MTEFTPKQEAFINEYLVDLNATQAAIRAGYSAKTADQQASRLLANVKMASAIASAKEERSKRTLITADAVVTELGKLGFANMMDYIAIAGDGTGGIDLSKLTRDQAAAITEITSEDTYDKEGNLTRRNKIKLADKRAALVDLGKHIGIFRDNNTAVAIVVNVSSDDAAL